MHLSGAHPSTVLLPTGARTASLHPLCAFADLEGSLAARPRAFCFVEREASDVAEKLARDLLVESGVPAGVALDALLELVRGSLDNVAKVGIPKGLTGPVARGDVDLVRRHVEALDGPVRDLYVALLEATLPLASAKAALAPGVQAALRRLLRR